MRDATFCSPLQDSPSYLLWKAVRQVRQARCTPAALRREKTAASQVAGRSSTPIPGF